MGWNSTLTRKTPLRAKNGIVKKPWRRKAKPSLHRKFSDLKRTPLKKVSKAQRRKLKEYYPERAAFLAANPYCIICVTRGIVPPNRSTEVHHIRGRAGKLISDTRFFAASCFFCRSWPHENAREARALGLLASPGEWGVRPPVEEPSI